jgi:hypothetical protein
VWVAPAFVPRKISRAAPTRRCERRAFFQAKSGMTGTATATHGAPPPAAATTVTFALQTVSCAAPVCAPRQLRASKQAAGPGRRVESRAHAPIGRPFQISLAVFIYM